MRLWLPLLLVSFAVQAADTGYLQALNSQVNAGVTYLGYAGWDFRDIPAGGQGNCAAIAYTKWKRLEENHYADRATLHTCTLTTGEAHAWLVVDDQWILDNINDTISEEPYSACQTAEIPLNLNSLREWVNGHGDHNILPRVAREARQKADAIPLPAAPK